MWSHPTALVESESVGDGTRIWAFAHVLSGALIGENCNICDHCFVEGGAVIGHSVTVKNGVSVWEGVRLADGVFVGPNVAFTNDKFPRSARFAQNGTRYNNGEWLLATTVDTGASIGANATIVCGITIGKYAMVAAGATVTSSIRPYALVAGSPARQIGWVCECGQKLIRSSSAYLCEICRKTYAIDAIEREIG